MKRALSCSLLVVGSTFAFGKALSLPTTSTILPSLTALSSSTAEDVSDISEADRHQTNASEPTIIVTAGAKDYTKILQSIFKQAPEGSTIRFQPGTYPVARGTTYVLNQKLTLVGNQSTLVNLRLLAL